MMAAIPQSSLLSISFSNFRHTSLKPPNLNLTQQPLIISLSTTKLTIQSHKPKRSPHWKLCAAPQGASAAPSVYVTGDGTSTVVSSLLIIAFIILSVLTVGVIYLAVTDFLTKRETDKYVKEQSEKKKKGGKKGKLRARAGPKGFGQKIVLDDDFDD
ncbi:hypothetical protein M5689_002712 [Euphorbia peplus]|nr:hypothetical protein M5689_002712 [Euphorbia peplus]